MGCGASRPQPREQGEQPARLASQKGAKEPVQEELPPLRRGSYSSPEFGGPAEIANDRLPKERFSTYSNHGIKPTMGGKVAAKINQDRGQLTYPLAGDDGVAMLAVFDGHGANGEQVSEFAMLRMPDLLEAKPERLKNEPSRLLTEAFEQIDKELRESSIATAASGSTGIVAILMEDELWTANVGDSRAVMGTRQNGKLIAKALSEDQKPDSPKEQQRIIAAGGYISPESPQHGPARVWIRYGEGPGLAMARSLGDHMCSHVGVIATPEVKRFSIAPEDEYIVMGSDGVWEFISNAEAINIVEAHQNAHEACVAIINEATRRWRKEEGNYRDDITCTVVRLPLWGDVPSARAAGSVAEPSKVIGDAKDVESEGDPDAETFQARRLTLACEPSEGDMMALANLDTEVEEERNGTVTTPCASVIAAAAVAQARATASA